MSHDCYAQREEDGSHNGNTETRSKDTTVVGGDGEEKIIIEAIATDSKLAEGQGNGENEDDNDNDEFQILESTMIDLLIRRGTEKTC